MSLSLIGSRFAEADLSRAGRLLFVRVDLPEGAIDVVASIVTHHRIGEEGRKRWLLGVNIQQMSDADTARLTAYLEKRAEGEPVIISE